MRKLRSFLFILAALLLIFSIGCSSSGTEDSGVGDGNANGEESNGEGSNDEEVVEIKFGYMDAGPTFDLYSSMFREYEEQNPNVIISEETIQDYETTLLTRIAGGNAPDVFWLSDTQTASYADRDGLLDLTPYDGGIFNSSDFDETSLEAYSYNGNIYGLPADAAPIVLFYNVDMFDEAGVDHPSSDMSWEQLLDVAKEMTVMEDGRVSRYGYAQELSAQGWAPWIWQNGGEILSEDGSSFLMNSEENIESLNFLRDIMVEENVAPDASAQETNPSWQTFTNGDAAMYFGGAWLASTELRNVDFKWNVVQSSSSLEQATFLAFGGFTAYKDTEHPEEVVEFLAWLAGEEGQTIKFADGFAGIPTVTSLVDSDMATKGFEHPEDDSISLDEIVNAFQIGRTIPGTPYYNEVMNAITHDLELFWLEEQDAATALENIEQQVNSILE